VISKRFSVTVSKIHDHIMETKIFKASREHFVEKYLRGKEGCSD